MGALKGRGLEGGERGEVGRGEHEGEAMKVYPSSPPLKESFNGVLKEREGLNEGEEERVRSGGVVR